MLVEVREDEEVVSKDYLRKLERISEILSDVEGALPSGLEGFVGDEEYEELFG